MKNLNFRKLIMAFAGLMLVASMLVAPVAKPENSEGGLVNYFQSLIGVQPAHAAGGIFYVAPGGSPSNDGSLGRPWDLQTALNQPRSAAPGSTFYLRGGTYRGAYTSNLNGTSSAYYLVKAVPGERVTLVNTDSPALDMGNTSYVVFWGLEITGSYGSRTTTASAYGVRVNQGTNSHHVVMVNMIIHDVLAQGIAWWQALQNSTIYGSLIYYNGVTKLDHGVYAHNVSGNKYFYNNIVFDNASHGFHGYAETADKGLNNMHLVGNTFFDNGSLAGTYKRNILMGGLTPAYNDEISNNFTYYPGSSGESLNLGYSAGSSGARVTNNYLMGGAFVLGGSNSNVTMTGNTVYAPGGFSGFNAGSYSANNWMTSKPTSPVFFIRPNLYDNASANITIYNWGTYPAIWMSAGRLAEIPALTPGRRFELHNAQDYYGDVIYGVYDGQGISVRMTNHSVAQPLAASKPASTFPNFGAFVLIVR